MSEQARAVLIGVICAILLTPVVVVIWRRLAPSRSQRSPLTETTWQHNASIQQQSIIAGLCMPIVLTAVFGPQSRIDLVGLGMIIGAVFAGALAWVIARTALRGTNGLREFGEFFEAKYHVSFASWLLVSSVATAVGIVCLAIFALRE